MAAADGLKAVLVVLLLQMTTDVTSQQTSTSCAECERNPTSCRRLAGLYTVTVLRKGTYNPVVEIPAQACSINITELAPSQNYLAVRTDSGENIVNGYGTTGSFRGVGTLFDYNRRTRNCPGECIYATGPTNRRITVQLLYYSKNPGIAYEFVLPNDVPFKPFDRAAPQVEARTRTQHQRGSRQRHHHRQHQNPSTTGAESSYDGGPGSQRAVISQVEEPRGLSGGSRRTIATVTGTGRGPTDTRTRTQPDYHGTSYGSHTLGGRGQSYTYRYGGDARPTNENQRPSYSSTSSTRRRPVFAPRPTGRREQSSSWRGQSAAGYYGQYDPNAGRGYQTSASSSRGGLIDRTYSRTLDTENRLQTFERPAVEQRPTLTIGTGGGGNEYEWTISGFTECSLTCGGGIQETKVVCVLTSAGTQVVVTEDNCQNAVKPRIQRVSCNNEPCPPGWVTDEWSDCSVTCGSGTQNRRIECKQRFSDTLELSVSASQCDQEQKPAVAQQCETDPCAEWRHGEWSECSEECGGGEKKRKVECVDGTGVQIPESYCPAAKPAETEQCNTQPCNTQWWVSRWSDQCSADCGSGLTTRNVLCTDRSGRPVAESACDASKRPQDRRRCESSTGCGNLWFAGPWSQCSDNCGQGLKTRQVVCMERVEGRGGLSAVEDDQCNAEDKPAAEEACFSTACGAQYYMTDWSQCSVTCGSGVRTREVKCLDETQRPSWSCDRSLTPTDREACQLTPCREEAPRERLPQTSTSASESGSSVSGSETEEEGARESDGEESDKFSEDEDDDSDDNYRQAPADGRPPTDGKCTNTFWNCRLVVQARLCKYPYYRGVCCADCRRVHHQHHHHHSKPSH